MCNFDTARVATQCLENFFTHNEKFLRLQFPTNMVIKLKNYEYFVEINHSPTCHLLIRSLICYFPINSLVFSIEKIFVRAKQSKSQAQKKKKLMLKLLFKQLHGNLKVVYHTIPKNQKRLIMLIFIQFLNLWSV